MNRPRDQEGKFQKFSELSDKTIGMRIYQKDEEKFYRIADNLRISRTELARKIIHQWLQTN